MASGDSDPLKPEDFEFEPLPDETSGDPAAFEPEPEQPSERLPAEAEGEQPEPAEVEPAVPEQREPFEFAAEPPEEAGEAPAFDLTESLEAEAPEGPTFDFLAEPPTEPASEFTVDESLAAAPTEETMAFGPPGEGEETAAPAGEGLAAEAGEFPGAEEGPAEEAAAEEAPSEEAAGITPGLLGLGLGEEAAEKEEAAEAKAEEEEEKEPRPTILQRIAEANPYTVLLGLAVAALIIACACLLAEWWRYDFDTQAKSAKRTAAAPAVERLADTELARRIG